VSLLSTITWIPGLLLFGIQGSLAGWNWMRENARIAAALTIGLVLWIVVLSLIALAVSAWVKWKVAAGAVLMGVFFAGAGFGSAVNQVLRTQNGYLLNLRQVIYTVWSGLFDIDPENGLSLESAWIALGAMTGVAVWLLLRRVRAFEVVK
jgi:ABC-2 type transport system permease protein